MAFTNKNGVAWWQRHWDESWGLGFKLEQIMCMKFVCGHVYNVHVHCRYMIVDNV